MGGPARRCQPTAGRRRHAECCQRLGIAVAIERVAEALLAEEEAQHLVLGAKAAAGAAVTRACIHKIAIGHSDLIKVRFALLC